MNSKSEDQSNNESVVSRRRILPRPANSICQFCSKTISTPNWSRHLRSRHMDDIARLQKQEEQLTTDTSTAVACSSTKQSFVGIPAMSGPQMLYGNELGQFTMDVMVQNQEQQEQKPGTLDEANQHYSTASSNTKTAAKHVVKTKSAIRLPKDNICPLCSRKTSPGNWCRHLKRHHPEFALLPNNNEQQKQNEQKNTLDGFFAGQMFQHNLNNQHNNNNYFTLFGDNTQQVVDHNRLIHFKIPNGKDQPTAEIYLSGCNQEQQQSLLFGSTTDNNEQQVAKVDSMELIGNNSLKQLNLVLNSNKHKKNDPTKPMVKKTRSLVKLPKDNICPLCSQKTSPGNWCRHVKRHHPEYVQPIDGNQNEVKDNCEAQQQQQQQWHQQQQQMMAV